MKSYKKIQTFIFSLCLMILGITPLSHAQSTFEAILSGSNEAPPITTTANGSISATLNGSELVVEGSFEGLTGDYAASHVHSAMAGTSGGVVVALSPTVDSDNRGGTFEGANNTFTLTTEQVATLEAQGMYINIHSSTFGSGELRGQIVPEADAHFRANFSGAFEFPVAKTMASGGAVLQLKGDSLIISGSFNNLTDEFDVAVAGGSHLHIGPAGRTGGIAIELVPTLESDNLSGVYHASENRFELTSEQKTALLNRDFYFNLHTKAFGAGELRGQVVPQSTATFFARLSGTAEVPSIETSAIGAIVLELHRDTLVVTGSFGNLSGSFDATIAGGSHLHIGHAGENGGIAVQLDAEVGIDLSGGVYLPEENKYVLTPEQIEALLNREMYLNIHTLAFASGELRGQVLGEAAAYFRTNLSGIHEVQPIITPAFGAINIELSSNNNAIVTGGFSGLTGNYDASIAGGAHLHAGSVTSNGSIAANLFTTVDQDTAGFYEASMNTISLTSEQAATLMAEGMYANIHTTSYASGELRGQLLFGNNTFPNPAELTAPANDASLTLAGDASILFEATWDEGSDIDNNEVTYIWQLSRDAAFTDLLVNTNVGLETSFSADFGTLATIFDEAGIEVGTTANLYHRVITSDGSNEKASEPRTANIERGQVTPNEVEFDTQPLTFGLDQNYPNPFNPSTSISFTLSETGNASLKIYNMLGQEIATLTNSRLTAGSYTFSFDASQLSSGMYIYQLRAENQTVTKRMTLIK